MSYQDILALNEANAQLAAKLDASEQREAELAAWQTEIRGAIERSGMGIMRTSQGPSGTMLGYRPEVEEEHDRKTLEVIHENVDLTIELKKSKEREAELRRVVNDSQAYIEARDALDMVDPESPNWKSARNTAKEAWMKYKTSKSRLTAILKGEQP